MAAGDYRTTALTFEGMSIADIRDPIVGGPGHPVLMASLDAYHEFGERMQLAAGDIHGALSLAASAHEGLAAEASQQHMSSLVGPGDAAWAQARLAANAVQEQADHHVRARNDVSHLEDPKLHENMLGILSPAMGRFVEAQDAAALYQANSNANLGSGFQAFVPPEVGSVGLSPAGAAGGGGGGGGIGSGGGFGGSGPVAVPSAAVVPGAAAVPSGGGGLAPPLPGALPGAGGHPGTGGGGPPGTAGATAPSGPFGPAGARAPGGSSAPSGGTAPGGPGSAPGRIPSGPGVTGPGPAVPGRSGVRPSTVDPSTAGTRTGGYGLPPSPARNGFGDTTRNGFGDMIGRHGPRFTDPAIGGGPRTGWGGGDTGAAGGGAARPEPNAPGRSAGPGSPAGPVASTANGPRGAAPGGHGGMPMMGGAGAGAGQEQGHRRPSWLVLDDPQEFWFRGVPDHVDPVIDGDDPR